MTKQLLKGTQWAVWSYVALFAILQLIQVFSSIIIPMEAAVYALMMIMGSYMGIDQVATFIASKALPAGQKYTGSKAKLKSMTLAIVFLLLEALIVQVLIQPRLLPLDSLFFAAGLVISLYVGGNKAANIAETLSPKE